MFLLDNLIIHKRLINEEQINLTLKTGIYTIGSNPCFGFYNYGFLIVLNSENQKAIQIYISEKKEIAFRTIWNKDSFNDIVWTKIH